MVKTWTWYLFSYPMLNLVFKFYFSFHSLLKSSSIGNCIFISNWKDTPTNITDILKYFFRILPNIHWFLLPCKRIFYLYPLASRFFYSLTLNVRPRGESMASSGLGHVSCNAGWCARARAAHIHVCWTCACCWKLPLSRHRANVRNLALYFLQMYCSVRGVDC